MGSKELPLKAYWGTLGAKFRIEKGWDVVAQFKDVSIEYEALHKHVGLIDRSYKGLIKVDGKDRLNFLHNVLSQDVKDLGLGEGCYATLLSGTGKVLADMQMTVGPTAVVLEVELSQVESTMKHLEKLLINEDAKLTNVTGQYSLLSVQGPKAEALTHAVFPGPFPELKTNHGTHLTFGKHKIAVIRRDLTKYPGYIVRLFNAGAQELAERILIVGKLYRIRPVGYDVAEITRIETGTPKYGTDFDENMTLPETGLEKLAASDTKGCYPGQEVVARTETYGGPKKMIKKFLLDEEVQVKVGDSILSNDQEVGKVTSACISPEAKKGIALGVIKADPKADSFEVKSGRQKIKACIQ